MMVNNVLVLFLQRLAGLFEASKKNLECMEGHPCDAPQPLRCFPSHAWLGWARVHGPCGRTALAALGDDDTDMADIHVVP